MSTNARLSGIMPRALFAVGLALALGAGAHAEDADIVSTGADQAAEPADQPRRRRDRRRQNTDAAAPAAAATDKPETAEPKLICRSVKLVGSRVARRVCGTAEEWAAANEKSSGDAEEGMRQMRGGGGITGQPQSGPASLSTPGMN